MRATQRGEDGDDDDRARWRRLVYDEGAPSVVLVGDAMGWCRLLAGLLEADGQGVLVDPVGEAARWRRVPFDVAVVDLDLTDPPAVDVVRALRARAELPILVVRPGEGRDAASLDALVAGADQLAWRDRPHEIVARVRALLRRSPPRRRHDVVDLTGSGPPIHLDPVVPFATVGDRTIELTEREALMLALLLERPGRVVTRAALAAPRRAGRSDHSVDALVRTLRAKLDSAGSARRIVAVRGVGFRLEHDFGNGSAGSGTSQLSRPRSATGAPATLG